MRFGEILKDMKGYTKSAALVELRVYQDMKSDIMVKNTVIFSFAKAEC